MLIRLKTLMSIFQSMRFFTIESKGVVRIQMKAGRGLKCFEFFKRGAPLSKLKMVEKGFDYKCFDMRKNPTLSCT